MLGKWLIVFTLFAVPGFETVQSQSLFEKSAYLSVPVLLFANSFFKKEQNSSLSPLCCMDTNPASNQQNSRDSSPAPTNEVYQESSFSMLESYTPLVTGASGDDDPNKGKKPRGQFSRPADNQQEEGDRCPLCLEDCDPANSGILACCKQRIHLDCAVGFRSAGKCVCGQQFLTQYRCKLCRDGTAFNNDGDVQSHFTSAHATALNGYSYTCYAANGLWGVQACGSRSAIRHHLKRTVVAHCPMPECHSGALNHHYFCSHYNRNHGALWFCPAERCPQRNSGDHYFDQHASFTIEIPGETDPGELQGTLDEITEQFIAQYTSIAYCAVCNPGPVVLAILVQSPVSNEAELMQHSLYNHCELVCPFCGYTESPSNQLAMTDHIAQHDHILPNEAYPPVITCPCPVEESQEDCNLLSGTPFENVNLPAIIDEEEGDDCNEEDSGDKSDNDSIPITEATEDAAGITLICTYCHEYRAGHIDELRFHMWQAHGQCL